MAKRYGLLVMGVAALAVMVGGAVWALAEYAKTGRCYRTGTRLSADELRARVIRSLLSAWMEKSAQLNEDKIRYQTFLIRRSMTPGDVIDAIASKSIANLPKEAAYPLNTNREVADIDPGFLLGEYSIVRYSATGYAEIVPSRSIEALGADSARQYFEDKSTHALDLGFLEKARGYGNHVFRADYYSSLDLGCCDKRFEGHAKAGRSADWYARSNIDPILKGEQPSHRYLVASNCGDILRRTQDEVIQFLFL